MELGGPGELWRVVPKNPANAWVAGELQRTGRGQDDESIAYYTSRTLLDDVLHAGGAIEYTVARIEVLCAAVQEYAAKHDLTASHDAARSRLSTAAVDEAYIEYANLLNWLRTLLDRMRSQDPYSKAKLGLIPALRSDTPLRRDVETVFDLFERKYRSEANLTNFGLHLHALPGGGTPVATVDAEGQTRLLIPDAPTNRINVFDQFTYNEERELVGFADAVIASVDSFVHALLSAFEEGTRLAMSQRGQPH